MASCRWSAATRLKRTKARTTKTLTSTARGEFSIVAAMTEAVLQAIRTDVFNVSAPIAP